MSLSLSREVPVWGIEIRRDDELDISAWVVEYKRNRTGRVWTEGPIMTQIQDKYGEYIQLGRFTTFEFGRPLSQLSMSITPCLGGKRPKRLYRAVHDGHPYNGVCARSYPNGPDPLLFQIQFEKHMKWKWRGLSPFMSATTSFGKAADMGEGYVVRGYKGVKILRIDTMEHGWESEQQLWRVKTLEEKFGITVPYAAKGEYLITHSIPLQHVKVLRWADLCSELRKLRIWQSLEPNRLPYSTMTQPEEGWLQHERNMEPVRKAAIPGNQKVPRNKADGIEQAVDGPKGKGKRKRDDYEKEVAPCPQGKRTKKFRPITKQG